MFRSLKLHPTLIKNIFRQSLSQNIAKNCWKCGHAHSPAILRILCEKCNVIQHAPSPNPPNHFSIFGIKENYNIDLGNLQKTYRQMQTLLHPDKFAKRSDDEKAISAEYSSLVNDAYNILTNPMSRALHMLNIHGETISEHDKSNDVEFLMRIMELNEALEEANSAADFNKLQEDNQKMLRKLESDIRETFEAGNVAKAKELVVQMQYYHTLSVKIREESGNRGFVD